MKQNLNNESLIRLWRGRVMSAKARYDLAAFRVRVTYAEFRDGTIPAPDRDDVYRHALQEERAAMREYSTALQFCCDLLLDGKAPDEQAWLEAKDSGAPTRPG